MATQLMDSFLMDKPTAEFYNRHVEGGSIHNEAAHSAISHYFEHAFKAGGKVLDIGAGSGRDLAVLLGMGFDAYGLEPNDAMRSYALRIHPELTGRLQPGMLPAIGTPFGGRFDGILCSAVMMHLPQEDLPRCAESLRALTNQHGRVLFSLPFMRPNLLDDERDPDGRFFKNHTIENFAGYLEKAGFSLIGNWDNGEYADTRWFTLLFELAVG
jgi:SAM-dependent methyltransferase